MERVNQHLAMPSGGSGSGSGSEDEDEMEWEERVRHVVVGVGSQGYNAVMHHTWGRTAQHHDAQMGLITSALAGEWARNEQGKQQEREIDAKM